MLGTLSTRQFDNPRDALKLFLRDLVDFLNNVALGEEQNWQPQFRETLIEPMRAALEALRSHAAKIDGRITNLSHDQIRDHGLEGAELEFKFSVINDAYRANVTGAGYWGWWRLIESLDVLLESILSATGSGSAIAEVKDYIGLSAEGP